MPDAGTHIMAIERRVCDVTPTARTNIVYPAFKRTIRKVIRAGIPVPEAHGISTGRSNRAIEEGDVRCIESPDRELMVSTSSAVTICILDRHVGNDHTGSP